MATSCFGAKLRKDKLRKDVYDFSLLELYLDYINCIN